MILQILLFFIGLSLILIGANSLVDGSSSLAKKMGVSEFVIGLTIIGIGTSAPEMVVSLIGSVKGNADIAVGNVLGSNIF
ncbi:MAG: sodium:calcium antiporter, partial [Bacteroidales bacterium]